MSDPREFESSLPDRMQDAARDVVAQPELHQRLIGAAAGSRTARFAGRSRRFPSAWLLPAAAIVTTLLIAGSVVAVQQLEAGRSSTPGDGAVLPATSGTTLSSTAAPSPTASFPRPLPPTSDPVTPRTSTHPSRTSSPTATQRSTSSDTTSATSSTSSSTSTSTSTAPASTPPTTPTSTHVVAPAYPAACSTPDTGEYHPTSVQDFTDHVLGTWLVCSDPSIFGTDEVGLQISPDGHWAKLTRDTDGELVAGTAPREQGTWVVNDDSEMNGHPAFQLNLKIDGSGTVIALARFSTGVTRVHLDNNGVYDSDYVPTSDQVK